MPLWKSKGDLAQTQIHGENLILKLRSKVKVKKGSWIYVIQRAMIIHSYVRYGMTTSKDQNVAAHTQSHAKNSIHLTLKWKVKPSKLYRDNWMYVTYPLMVIDPCAKYSMQMSKQKSWAGHKSTRTDGQTKHSDRRTHRQADWQTVFYIPPELHSVWK